MLLWYLSHPMHLVLKLVDSLLPVACHLQQLVEVSSGSHSVDLVMGWKTCCGKLENFGLELLMVPASDPLQQLRDNSWRND